MGRTNLIRLIIFCLMLVSKLALAQDTCDAEMNTRTDKFAKEKTIETSSFDPISIVKVINGKSSTYYLSLRAYGETPIARKKGVIVLFSDGTKFSKPAAEVDCEVNSSGDGYEYTSFITLLPTDVTRFAQKIVSDIRLYIFNNEIGERNARELKCGANELLKIK